MGFTHLGRRERRLDRLRGLAPGALGTRRTRSLDWTPRRSLHPLSARPARYRALDDAGPIELMQRAASHIDALAARLLSADVRPLALVGGLADAMAPWVSSETRRHLAQPAGDALEGAIALARVAEECQTLSLQVTDTDYGRG